MESLNEIDAEDLMAFIVEGHEILTQFEQDVLNLEKGSFDQQRLNQLYRALHTIKGNCGFLPLPKLEAIAHAGETLLDTLRTTQQNISPGVATALLQLTDAIRQTLHTIEATATEGDQDYAALITTLTTLCTPTTGHSPLLPHSPAPPTSTEAFSTQIQTFSDSTPDSTIRVHVDLLDHVMNLVSELVLVRNRVLQLMPGSNNPALISTCQQINLITNELQDSVMQTRMQPISVLWRNLPRLVRETAIACHKEVILELEGSETELDRSLIAAIKDPIIHLVRNCIDHGIEAPHVRVAHSKPAAGTLTLRALQENGQIILEIRDDGAGIDAAQVKARSQQIGLITATQAESLSDRETLDLIFLPGFSTSDEVTRLSGRGVGMDVVRRNLESVNGTIEIDSQLGCGTTFRLKIPLTLAILPALLVCAGGERFTIPQASVQELVRIEGTEQIEKSIETLLNVPVYRLRGQILPLVNLTSVLQLTPSDIEHDVLYFVVMAIDGYRFGLIVDQIIDTQDIVVKPLSKQLKSLVMFAGVTVLGDGKAALILDVAGLAQHAGVQRQSDINLTTSEVEQSDRQLILTVLGPQNSRLGICLSHATRLEMIPAEKIEQIAGQYVMQYRDRIASLIDLEALFTGVARPLPEFDDVIPVVVISLEDNRTVGLVVHQILDIAEESLTVTGAANRPGVQCYATVQGQITEMLDLEALIDLANPYRVSQELMTGVGG
ncbi:MULTISPECIES: chemotaxis protein CheA [unclassified Leptolyngbya]|uniref:chemotaxis protein CheA n=1 Tax=unclassified Leptolyngbya TaxID=2650499 RepID=UPI001688B2BB|nr:MULTISPECIES: chemotaxis protein CheA [unclassified Leptolyngbya]MBD1913813.1 chemotaxis protein CheA [Leptolyngbya sp. FACHB-8]MBD2156548.1 chemotaxis protein CheA [Leptolyngbya sp. FACHB-16]